MARAGHGAAPAGRHLAALRVRGAQRERVPSGRCLTFLVVLAATAVAGGCGSGSSGPTPEEIARSRVEQERYQIMVRIFDTLDQVGMGEWAAYGREFLSQGKIVPMDFSSPDANPFHVSGLDGAANFSDGKIYIDETTWVGTPPRMLVIIMLDELSHFRYMTGDHTEYNRLKREYILVWEAIHGREIDLIVPGDEPYLEWFKVNEPGDYQNWVRNNSSGQ